ncbi:questin oxidase family protein [Nonomuraea maheshkhaliensis]|uniref:Questin oxidase family protein n=1 Tax=Nonomuraea maheshkhaliensis TaxID=419590 RepID=A0ABN2EUG5_9ACTN
MDEAYGRLHTTGPEFDGWLSNHGPMAVESMVRHGYGREVHRWLDTYVGRLDELPRGSSPIEAAEWREALGDPGRLGDWLAYFDRELREQPWRAVLGTWWPRLLPGIAAGATHGVIRTGHAIHALLGQEDEPRIAELGQALGYWAARWQAIAGFDALSGTAGPERAGTPAGTNGPERAVSGAPDGTAGPEQALAGVPRVPDQSADINHRLGQLADLTGWGSSLAALKPAADPQQARAYLTELADAATLRYATHAHGNAVMLVHTATAPTAVLRALPALPAEVWVASFNAAWAAGAAVTAAYAPDEPAPRGDLPAGPAEAEEAFELAVRHGDEHVIKLADTALDVYQRTDDPDALAAVVRAAGLIKPLR